MLVITITYHVSVVTCNYNCSTCNRILTICCDDVTIDNIIVNTCVIILQSHNYNVTSKLMLQNVFPWNFTVTTCNVIVTSYINMSTHNTSTIVATFSKIAVKCNFISQFANLC